jgi:hypothetical protein
MDLLVSVKTLHRLLNKKTPISLHVALLLSLGVVFSACQKAEKTSATGGLTGVYALLSLNGKPMPASVSHEGTALQVRSGTFSIKPDGTCSTRTVFVPPSGTEATREVNATYTKDGAKLTMQWQGAGVTTATVQGNTLTMNNEGMVFVYRK